MLHGHVDIVSRWIYHVTTFGRCSAKLLQVLCWFLRNYLTKVLRTGFSTVCIRTPVIFVWRKPRICLSFCSSVCLSFGISFFSLSSNREKSTKYSMANGTGQEGWLFDFDGFYGAQTQYRPYSTENTYTCMNMSNRWRIRVIRSKCWYESELLVYFNRLLRHVSVTLHI